MFWLLTVDTAVDSRSGVGKRLLANRSFSLGQSPTTSPIQPHPASASAGSTSSTGAGSTGADPPRTLLRGILSQQPGVPLGLNLHILQPGHPALRPATHGSGTDYILPHTGSHHSSLLHPHAGKPGKYRRRRKCRVSGLLSLSLSLFLFTSHFQHDSLPVA